MHRPILAVLLLLLSTGTPPAAAEPRVALVVGNRSYTSALEPLANPVNDAEAISDALRATGFDVELVPDADGRTMDAALDRLRERIRSAGPGTTALFYYAGHGMQAGEVNYLAPVNTVLLERDGVAADAALLRMEEAGAETKIVILDACRDSPTLLLLGAVERGFRRMSALERGRGVFIAYSTAVGQTATDGEGNNSPFAAALAQAIIGNEGPIEVIFRTVRAQVVHATRGQQTPWDSNSLTTAFTFARPGISPSATTAALARTPLIAPPSPVPGGSIRVRDFESVPTATAPNFTVAAKPYLREGPFLVRVRDIAPAGSEVVFVNNRGVYEGSYAAPTVSQNLLTQVNTGNTAASFTLELPRPMRRVHLMLPRLFPDTASGVTAPAWRAAALGRDGRVLDVRERPLARSMTIDVPSQVITLEALGGEGITAVRLDSDPRILDANGNLVPFAATSALLLEAMWVEPLDPFGS